jgi:hypothetical protein
VERRARTLRRVAVPTAILKLLVNEPAHQTFCRAPEVGAKREHAAVDARFHFPFEETFRAEFLVPTVTRFETSYRRLDGGICGVDAARAQ